MKLDFDPGFDITPLSVDEGFRLGADCFDKGTEFRKLDSVRKSLRDPNCDGPENVYAIMMDVGRKTDLPAMQQRMLLYGVVTYAAGQLGDEPIRSQGHIHKISAHCGWSTPEVYEIWTGKAVIYMQESGQDDPGRCFAVVAGAGDVVIVPPGWVHATISADPKQPLTFGAWCDRDYGFEYADVRRHGGIAWFPLLTAEENVCYPLRLQKMDKEKALELARRLEGKAPIDFPPETALGALALYVSNETVEHFQPMNINFGIMPPLGYRVKGKRNKNAALSQRSLEILAGLEELGTRKKAYL